MSPQRRGASHSLGQLAGRWFTEEDLVDLRLIWRWLIVCVLSCFAAVLFSALVVLLTALGPALDQFDAWRADMRTRLATAQAEERDRAYIAWVQGECGPETWWKPDGKGALVCTDKYGRASRRELVGAQP